MLTSEALILIKTTENNFACFKIENARIEKYMQPCLEYDFEVGTRYTRHEHEITISGKQIELDKEGQALFKAFIEKENIESFLELPKQKLIEKLFLEEE